MMSSEHLLKDKRRQQESRHFSSKWYRYQTDNRETADKRTKTEKCVHNSLKPLAIQDNVPTYLTWTHLELVWTGSFNCHGKQYYFRNLQGSLRSRWVDAYQINKLTGSLKKLQILIFCIQSSLMAVLSF